MLAVWLLGTFRAVAGEGAFDDSRWRLRKARAVVKLLSLAPGHSLPRERLLDLLWPDLAPEAASNNLRYTLHVARRALAGAGEPALSFLRTDGDQVHLYPGGEVWTDVGAFEAAAAEARRKREIRRTPGRWDCTPASSSPRTPTRTGRPGDGRSCAAST